MIHYKTMCTVSIVAFLSIGCSKDDIEINALVQPSTVKATNSGAKIAAPLDLEQIALLVAQTATEPAIQQEVYKGVKAKWEGVSVVLIKHLLNEKTDKGESLPFSSKVFSQNLSDLYQKDNYTKVKNGKVEKDLLRYLKTQDIKIHWHYWQEWDGKETPTVTFNPSSVEGENVASNIGYRFIKNGNDYSIEKVTVDDDYAYTHPTWIIDTYKPMPANDKRSGRFIPNYGDFPKINQDKAARVALGVVPGPYDGTAAVNQVFVDAVRTGGLNFEDGLISSDENRMIFLCADEIVTSNPTGKSSNVVTIDRWAGRNAVWRSANAEWDNNWKATEEEQAVGVLALQTPIRGVDEFSGSISLQGISQAYKRTINYKDVLMGNNRLERAFFLNTRDQDVYGHGIYNNNPVRKAQWDSRRTIYYTLNLVPYNYN